ncbi:BMC domain-containing protein [Bacillus pseudomycoides]|uniref:BMC domain-containing protein n=1 Tax=Bacillus pseudomycoides TaxID=64104 RepID=UPI002FFEACF8
MMNSSIGVLELRSISKGYELADKMLKQSSVEMHVLRPICPGKFLIIISGEAEDVNEAKGFLVDTFLLHGVHEEILLGLKNRYPQQETHAVGIFEASNVSAGIFSINKALKEATISLKRMTLGMGIGGKFVAIFTGTVSDVEQGMKIAVLSIDKKRVVHYTVIPSPSELMKKYL